MLGSIDANQGDYLLGWDPNEFPFNVYETTMCMYEVLKAGGLTGGFIAERYASYNTGIGAKIRSGETTLEELAAYAEEMGAPALTGSGRQEYLEAIVNHILFFG